MVHDFTIRVNVSHILQDFLRGYAFLAIRLGRFDNKRHFGDPSLVRFKLRKLKRPHPYMLLTIKSSKSEAFQCSFRSSCLNY